MSVCHIVFVTGTPPSFAARHPCEATLLSSRRIQAESEIEAKPFVATAIRLRPVLDFREIDLSDDLAIVVEHAGEP